MDSQAIPIERHLTAAAAGGADASSVAARVVDALLAIDGALAPVIGPRGVLALYGRSLHLSALAFPWLSAAPAASGDRLDVTQLAAVLKTQAAADAAAGGITLLRHFNDLLVSLVGSSLTERMLRPVWAPYLGDSPAQDTSP